MLDSDAQLLKEKALLLLTRERELLSLRRRHDRVSAWLTVARSLSELVTPRTTPEDTFAAVAGKLMTLLGLQKVTFFEVTGRATLRPLTQTGAAPEGERELDGATAALFQSSGAGLCNAPDSEPMRALSEAVGLHRFMWCQLADAGTPGSGAQTLMVAGYEREKATFYAPFEDADFAHFKSMAEHLALQLRNATLIKQLEQEKRSLEDLNQTLERRVAERTDEIARASRGLAETLAVLRDRDRRLQDDLEQARSFQQSILPAAPSTRALEMRTVYRPLELVGGDIYDITELEEGHLRVFMADATGHGVQASLRTIVLKSEYDRLKGSHAMPDTLLKQFNRRLARQYSPGEMLCTGCCFDLIPGENGSIRVRYVNAAHPALLRVTGGGLEEIYCDGPFLGLSADIDLTMLETTLLPGDALFAYTDGLCDQMNGTRQSFPLEAAALEALVDAPPIAEVLARIIDSFDAFRGAAPVADDVTLIGARLRPAV